MNKVLQEKCFQEAFRNKIIQMVAPASSTSPEKMIALRAINDLNINIPVTLLSDDIPYHANNDDQRFELLKTALMDESDNTLIWALRGGYGCARLLDKLHELPIPLHQKTFIGFSDNTALHLFLSQHWHWATIHGSVLTQLLDPEQNPENFIRIAEIISKKVEYQTIESLMLFNKTATQHPLIQGPLTGGNLTLLEDSIGTHWEVQTAGKILFIEEVGEKGYRIDRSLYHLFQAGLFKQVKAIIFGEFLEAPGDSLASFALKRFAEEMDVRGIPVYKTDQFGHGNQNMPFIYQAHSEVFLRKNENSAIFRMKLPE